MLCYLIDGGNPQTRKLRSFVANFSHSPTNMLPPSAACCMQFPLHYEVCAYARLPVRMRNLETVLCLMQSQDRSHNFSRLTHIFEIPKLHNTISRLHIFPNCAGQILHICTYIRNYIQHNFYIHNVPNFIYILRQKDLGNNIFM